MGKLANHKIPYKRILIGFISIALVIVLISITLGKEWYNESGETDLFWFAFIHFLGYLFFLLMPVEMVFIMYLPHQNGVLTILSIAMATAVFAQLIDYFIGYTFSNNVINKWIGKKRFEKAENKIKKYGNWVVFAFNVTPLSSPIIALAAGMVKHPLGQLLLYSISGLFLKYLILSLILGS